VRRKRLRKLPSGREFIRLVGGAALGWWPTARTQQVARIAALLQKLELLDRLTERGDRCSSGGARDRCRQE
jgi:hypothetical protein